MLAELFAPAFAGPLRCPAHPAGAVVAAGGGFRCVDCDRRFAADGPVWDCAPDDAPKWFADESEQWDAQADRYDAGRAADPQYLSHVVEGLRRLAPRRADAVLDAGCGTGLTSRRLAGRVGSLTCLDASGRSLERLVAAVRPHPVLAVRGDVLHLPFADESFDRVLCGNVLQQIRGHDNRRRAVAELARVTRPGGRVVLTTHAFSRRKRRLGWTKECDRARGPSGPVSYVYRVDRAELRELLAEFLAVRGVTGAAFPVPYRLGLGPASARLDAALRRVPAAAPWGEFLVGVGRKA